MNEFFLNILATIVGGLLLTFCLFLLNEYCFNKKNLTGEWDVTVKVQKSSYSSFENLSIKFKFHLLQKGSEISGSGEKVQDINPDGSNTIFDREKRIIVHIDGYYERKYIRKSNIFLSITEDGEQRETRVTYFLRINNATNLKGTFISTAGDASGQIEMTKS